MDSSLDALYYYLESNPDLISGAQEINFYNAKVHKLLDLFNNSSRLSCMQTFRPYFLQLRSYNLATSTKIEDKCDIAIVDFGKHKQEALWHLGLAIKSLNHNGKIFAAGSNDLGSKSLQKKLENDYGISLESYSKKKCRVLTINQKDIPEAAMEELLDKGNFFKLEGSDLTVSATSFSSKKIDAGSLLLTEYFNQINTKGHGADFGSGYGYLSYFLLNNKHKASLLDLYEADYLSLECAKINLNSFSTNCKINFNWTDLFSETPQSNLDWIIMNPPFHLGDKTNAGIGLKFIQSAARSLRSGGELLMVANRLLPYKKFNKKLFSKHNCLVEKNGFKVILAIK
ncbi:MAG: class I SAM-dependent methyltransferase [Bdellovibrionales bacterium]|nr:class I SAM-dependent methyltransferase [Bdellovibrionales bacterium]